MNATLKAIRLQMIADAVEKVNSERNQQSDEFKLDEINEPDYKDEISHD